MNELYNFNDDHDDDAGDEWDDLLSGGSDEDETGDDGSDKSKDGIRAGELEAFNKAKEIIGEDSESFKYFPDDATEENNQRFSMAQLKEEFGGETHKNIGIANFFYKNFLNDALRKEAENTGIASHYLMVIGFYKAAREAEKFGKEMMSGNTGDGLKKLRFKDMAGVTKQKLEERCRELASRVYNDAKNKIIAINGPISHGG